MLASATPLPLAGPYVPQDFADPGMSASQIGSILRAYRKQALLIAGGVVLAAALGCLLWPRTYEATATLMVNFEVNDPLNGKEFPTGLLGSYMATQVELARGSDVLLAVVDRLKLAASKEYASGYSGEAAGLRDWVETRVRKGLLVEQGRYGSQLIYVTYAAQSAAAAALVANAVAEVYSAQQFKRLSGPANQRAQRYTEQLSELKGKVAKAQEQATDFRRRSGLIDTDAKIDLDAQLLSTLEGRLLEAQNARRGAEARGVGDQSVGSQVLGSPMIQALKTQLAVQGAHLAEMRATLGPRHPQILETESQIRATRQALNAELHAYTGNAAAELNSARQLERKLQDAVNTQRADVIRVRQLQDSGAKYQLELESAQSVYKRALDGYDQVMFASTGGYTNVDLVSRAKPPPKPSKPKVRLVLLLASVAGVLLGFGIPLGYELFHRRVRCRDDLERDHGIPVLVELGPIGRLSQLQLRGAA